MGGGVRNVPYLQALPFRSLRSCPFDPLLPPRSVRTDGWGGRKGRSGRNVSRSCPSVRTDGRGEVNRLLMLFSKIDSVGILIQLIILRLLLKHFLALFLAFLPPFSCRTVLRSYGPTVLGPTVLRSYVPTVLGPMVLRSYGPTEGRCKNIILI